MEHRALKFRAYDTNQGKWLHTTQWAVNLTGEIIMFGEFWRREDDSIVPLKEHNGIYWMQFTGVKDKNGVEIFEGDLMTAPMVRAEVVFRYGAFWLKSRFDLTKLGESNYQLLHPKASELEVSGNIFDKEK